MESKDILFVVVLYNETLGDCNTCRTLVASNKDVALLVFDNSPSAMHPEGIDRPNTVYVSRTDNPGLSYAYNYAAQYALEKGFGWLLLLDQDTEFTAGILSHYIAHANEHPNIMLFAPRMVVSDGRFISPVLKRFWGTKLERQAPRGVVSIKSHIPINSGMLINVEAFLKVGGYNNSVVLDFSDYQFIERFARHYDTFYVLSDICRQQFSDQVQSKKQKLTRFSIFCNCLKNCEKHSFKEYLFYFCIILKRTCSLIISTRSLAPVKISIKKYL